VCRGRRCRPDNERTRRKRRGGGGRRRSSSKNEREASGVKRQVGTDGLAVESADVAGGRLSLRVLVGGWFASGKIEPWHR
jgi:hypothetical protein